MLRVLVLTGGHPFDRPSFNDMLDALPDVWWEEVAHPEAQARLAPGRVGADVVLAYDLPGVTFRPGQPPLLPAPSPELVAGMEGLLDEGQPFVFLHHALASWPAWPEFAEIVGGRYHYAPATLRGQEWPDSGYRHDVHQTLRVVAPDHPVCAGRARVLRAHRRDLPLPRVRRRRGAAARQRRSPHRPGPLVDDAWRWPAGGTSARVGTIRRAARSRRG